MKLQSYNTHGCRKSHVYFGVQKVKRQGHYDPVRKTALHLGYLLTQAQAYQNQLQSHTVL